MNGKDFNDYTLDDVLGTDKQYTPPADPVDFFLPGNTAKLTQARKEADMPNVYAGIAEFKAAKADRVPEGYDPGVATPNSLHIKAGKELEKFGVKLLEKDSDGLPPGAHGSAWLADPAVMNDLVNGLHTMGYRPKGKGRFIRGPVMIEMGKTPEHLYIYITDDNGILAKKKETKVIMKTELGEEHPAAHYLVVENPFKPSTWHLRVYDKDGKIDHHLMGNAWAALHKGFRSNPYEGPQKRDALAKLKKLYAAEKLETPK